MTIPPTAPQPSDRVAFLEIPAGAARCGAAASLALVLWLLAGACSLVPSRPYTIAAAEATPGSCAWFADRRGNEIVFGESAFWSLWRGSFGSPAAAATPQPARIGRFDLETERLLEPLQWERTIPGGTWDVLAVGDRIYFTALFGAPGWIDVGPRHATRLASLGSGSNEIIALPDGGVALTRYAEGPAGGGAVLILSEAGDLVAEFRLEAAEAGWSVAPKSLAYDAPRGWIWVNTDLLPGPPVVATGGPGARHGALALDFRSGEIALRIAQPELQTMAFDAAGRGYWVWSDAGRLVLRVTDPDGERGPRAGRAWVLEASFAGDADFAQEIRIEPGNRVVVTRWSGVVHVLEPSGALRSLALPRLDPAGLYYSAFVHGERVCATYCSGVRVVCAALP